MSDRDLPEHDPQLSALYRRSSADEPAMQLDAQILAQAQRQAARRRQRRWLPLATAAVMVLAVGVLLRHQQRPDELLPQVALDVAQEEPPVAATPIVAERAPAVREAPSPVQEEKAVSEEQAERSRTALHDEQRAKAKAETSAKRALAEVTPERESLAAAPAPSLRAGMAASEPLPAASLDMAAEAKRVEPAPQAALAAPLEKQVAAPEAPEAWLKRIEALRAKGDIDAAKRELAAFRKAYPAWTLPKSLLPLLPPTLPQDEK